MVTLEELRCTAFPAARPGAVGEAIVELIDGDLNEKYELWTVFLLPNKQPCLAVDRLVNKGVHHGGYGRIENKGNEKEKSEQGDDCHSAEGQGGVILDVLESGRLILFLFGSHGQNLK